MTTQTLKEPEAIDRTSPLSVFSKRELSMAHHHLHPPPAGALHPDRHCPDSVGPRDRGEPSPLLPARKSRRRDAPRSPCLCPGLSLLCLPGGYDLVSFPPVESLSRKMPPPSCPADRISLRPSTVHRLSSRDDLNRPLRLIIASHRVQLCPHSCSLSGRRSDACLIHLT